MILRRMTLAEAEALPLWRRPESLLFLMAFAMPIAFATWSAVLNNFVIEMAGFTGVEIGWLHTVREIPGLLAVLVIAILLVMREQVLAVIALALLLGRYSGYRLNELLRFRALARDPDPIAPPPAAPAPRPKSSSPKPCPATTSAASAARSPTGSAWSMACSR